MRKYLNYCTEAQAIRAYQLGLQLDYNDIYNNGEDKVVLIQEIGAYYNVPTTQEMIGWLREENGLEIVVISSQYPDDAEYEWIVMGKRANDKENVSIHINKHYEHHAQAELDAIDAALDYLEGR